ncbi:MAG: hypothetical protein ABSH48_28020, partial [Verrucomicrobiota bacterium]
VGLNIGIGIDAEDVSGNDIPSDVISVWWGPGSNDGINVYTPDLMIPDCSIGSVQTLITNGLSAALPYDGDATLSYGFDPSGFNGAWGALATFYGTANQTQAPWLALSQSGRGLALRWPTNATGFSLLSSSFLGSSAAWTAVSNRPVVVGTNYSVSLPVGAGSRFFRLQSIN